ncbi:MAG: hypothetical protein IPM82_30195 [Saprospiraceae bacterium]|nr:hypothetical protein [Saprospiraceae bacterium]
MQHPDLNIAIFGHAKHGKSTLAGRLLHEFGAIDFNKLQDLAEQAKSRGKDFNAYNLAYLERRPKHTLKTHQQPDDEREQ